MSCRSALMLSTSAHYADETEGLCCSAAFCHFIRLLTDFSRCLLSLQKSDFSVPEEPLVLREDVTALLRTLSMTEHKKDTTLFTVYAYMLWIICEKKKNQQRNNYMAWWIRKVETEKTTSLPVYRYACVSSTERKITLQGVFVIPVDYSITSLIIVLHHLLGHTFRKASGHLADHCTDLILSMYRFSQDRISLNTAAQNSNYC